MTGNSGLFHGTVGDRMDNADVHVAEENVLLIAFKDGSERVYSESAYDDYKLIDNTFVVVKHEEYVGIYNMSEVRYIERTCLHSFK